MWERVLSLKNVVTSGKDKKIADISTIESCERRIFLKKAAYTAPVLMVFGTLPSLAYGSHTASHTMMGMGMGRRRMP